MQSKHTWIENDTQWNAISLGMASPEPDFSIQKANIQRRALESL